LQGFSIKQGYFSNSIKLLIVGSVNTGIIIKRKKKMDQGIP